jgi:chemotaxis protein MotB
MRRQSTNEEHETHERWLISYSDFITLMFAFFVVMFATSEADRNKAQQVSDSVTRALEQDQVGDRIRQMLGREPKAKPISTVSARPEAGQGKLAELTPSLKHLTRELEEEIRSGKLQVSLEPRGLVVSLKEAAIFPTAEDTLSPDAYGILLKVTNTIRVLPNPVRLEGHTDSRPISNQRFRDNWDLSGARSVAMLHVLVQRFGDPERVRRYEGSSAGRGPSLTCRSPGLRLGHPLRAETSFERLHLGQQSRPLDSQQVRRPCLIAAAAGQRLLH